MSQGLFGGDRPALIGMVHLEPLPGSPRYGGDWSAVLEAARRDAAALAQGGADAILLENFGDSPFFRTKVPRITIAAMTAAALVVREAGGGLPMGVNVLRNDARAALAVAIAAGASFIRVNVLSGARLTDQGIIQGIAAEMLRDRRALEAEGVAIWADVDVKHSAALAPRELEDEVADLIERGGADALIVSGSGTGKATDPAKLARVRRLAGEVPVLVGSGATAKSAGAMRPHASGFIVGTALKRGGRVDVALVREMALALR
jgi:membrane complex biogenesis BtpA family protein